MVFGKGSESAFRGASANAQVSRRGREERRPHFSEDTDYLSKWIECVNSTAFSAGYSGLDLNGRWLSIVNRFSSAPTISLADSESLPSSRLTFCWAQVFHVGCDRPNNRNRSLTSPSGHPRTGPVLALRPSNLP